MSIKPRMRPKIKGERESYIPRDASAEAIICLNCPLPDCTKFKCERLEEELRKIRSNKNG